MNLQIVVTNTEEAHELGGPLPFSKGTIIIGRDESADLTLPDEKRIISRRHAKIQQDGATFWLVDLDSRNATFLNGERLQPEQPYALQNGDTFSIGEFELQVSLFEAPPEPFPEDDANRTLFDENPFEEDVTQLVSALRRICATYDREATFQAKDKLMEAVLAADAYVHEPHEAKALVASLLGSSPGPSPSNGPLPSKDYDKQDRLINALLQFLSELISIPRAFRLEFCGLTIVQSPETDFLYQDDPEALRDQLLSPGLPETKFEWYLELIEDAADEGKRHHMGMLAGYRAIAQEATNRLLDVVDPSETEQMLTQSSVLYRLFPTLRRAQAAKELAQKCQELRAENSEDWSAAESRVFRLVFCNAYLASTSPQQISQQD